MSYTRTNWVDEVTPLDAEHMNNIEDGIEQALTENFHILGSFNEQQSGWNNMCTAAANHWVNAANSLAMPCVAILAASHSQYKFVYIYSDNTASNTTMLLYIAYDTGGVLTNRLLRATLSGSSWTRTEVVNGLLGSFSDPSTMYRDILTAAKNYSEATTTPSHAPMYAIFQGVLMGIKKVNTGYELEDYLTGNKAYCYYSSTQGIWIVRYDTYTCSTTYQGTMDDALKQVYTDLNAIVSASHTGANVIYNILKGRVEYGDDDHIFIESFEIDLGYMIGYLQPSEDSFPGSAEQGQPNYFMAFYDITNDDVKILFGVFGTTGAQYQGSASSIGDGLEATRSSLGQLTQVHFESQGHNCVAFALAANNFAVLSDDPNFTFNILKVNNTWKRKPLAGPHLIETGALTHKAYSELQNYQVIFCYGYRDALDAPNQFMFAFMPDQLIAGGEDLQFLTMAGSSNWQYPVRVKRGNNGMVSWYSGYDYGGNTTFYVTKILGI